METSLVIRGARDGSITIRDGEVVPGVGDYFQYAQGWFKVEERWIFHGGLTSTVVVRVAVARAPQYP
jgi:hypothetical protein